MFGLGPATKIYIAVEAVDMRKGFAGLYGLVRDQLPFSPEAIWRSLASQETRSLSTTNFRSPSSSWLAR